MPCGRATFSVLCAIFVFASAAFGETNAVVPSFDVGHTEKHVKFFDIPVEFVPSETCRFAKTKSGAADTKNKFAAEASFYSVPFAEFSEEISHDVKNTKGLYVKSFTRCVYNGKDAVIAKLVCIRGKARIGKWVLAAEEGDGTWMLSISYDTKGKNAAQMALSMLKSARWDSEYASASMLPSGTVDTSGTPFKIAAVRCDSLVFTRDGSLPTQHTDRAIFVASEESCGTMPDYMREEYAKKRFAEIDPTTVQKISSVSAGNIDGHAEVTIVAFSGEDDKTVTYQTLIFGNSTVTALVGIAKGNTADNLKYFYKLAVSYKTSY